jgi:hypothetical protein
MRRRTTSQYLTLRVGRLSRVDVQVAHRRGRFAPAMIIARKQRLKEN